LKEVVRDTLLAVSVVAPDCLDEVSHALQIKSKLDSGLVAILREQGRQAGAEEARWIFENRKHADTAALEAAWTKNGVFF
jgi:GTP cyclohydrolase II